MTILVVSGRPLGTDWLRVATERRPLEHIELFVVYLVQRRRILRHQFRRRFWTARHAELDSVLFELSSLGIAADGIVTTMSPAEAFSQALVALEPSQAIVVATGTLSHSQESLSRALARYESESGRALQAVWLAR